jgi:pimeloyl-ACP methyl ester carboxylesterase
MADYVITFVHGTFAQGASWIQHDALLPSRARNAGEGQVLTFPFTWSGENTHAARVAAGRELAKSLEERAKQYPSARQAVVAHSHGGNIALYAARALSISDLKIVTLGAPFISAGPRPVEQALEMWAQGVFLLAATWLPLLLLFLFVIPINTDAPVCDFVHRCPFLPNLNSFIALLVLYVSGFGLCLIGQKWRRSAVLPWIINRQNWLSQELTASCSTKHKLLLVSVRSDEAMATLSLVDLLAEIPSVIIIIMMFIVRIVREVGFALDRILGLLRPFVSGLVLLLIIIPFILIPIAFSLLVIPVLFLGLIRRAGYWDDKIIDYAIARIKVTAQPIINWTDDELLTGRSWPSPIRNIVYPSRSAITSLIFQHLLQHSSLYQREDIASDICSWLLHDRWPSAALLVNTWGLQPASATADELLNHTT